MSASSSSESLPPAPAPSPAAAPAGPSCAAPPPPPAMSGCAPPRRGDSGSAASTAASKLSRRRRLEVGRPLSAASAGRLLPAAAGVASAAGTAGEARTSRESPAAEPRNSSAGGWMPPAACPPYPRLQQQLGSGAAPARATATLRAPPPAACCSSASCSSCPLRRHSRAWSGDGQHTEAPSPVALSSSAMLASQNWTAAGTVSCVVGERKGGNVAGLVRHTGEMARAGSMRISGMPASSSKPNCTAHPNSPPTAGPLASPGGRPRRAAAHTVLPLAPARRPQPWRLHQTAGAAAARQAAAQRGAALRPTACPASQEGEAVRQVWRGESRAGVQCVEFSCSHCPTQTAASRLVKTRQRHRHAQPDTARSSNSSAACLSVVEHHVLAQHQHAAAGGRREAVGICRGQVGRLISPPAGAGFNPRCNTARQNAGRTLAGVTMPRGPQTASRRCAPEGSCAAPQILGWCLRVRLSDSAVSTHVSFCAQWCTAGRRWRWQGLSNSASDAQECSWQTKHSTACTAWSRPTTCPHPPSICLPAPFGAGCPPRSAPPHATPQAPARCSREGTLRPAPAGRATDSASRFSCDCLPNGLNDAG